MAQQGGLPRGFQRATIVAAASAGAPKIAGTSAMQAERFASEGSDRFVCHWLYCFTFIAPDRSANTKRKVC
jgi:hypothetical protein